MRTHPIRAATAALGIATLIAACDAATASDPPPAAETQELNLESSLLACTDNPAPFDPTQPYEPDLEPGDLDVEIDNQFNPLPIGARWVFEMDTPDGLERGVVTVKPGTKNLWGTRARIVRDTVTLDGELLEDTFDWFAQDDEDNVWYMGEHTTQYENGEPVGHEGSWKSGVHGALPGVVMLRDPHPAAGTGRNTWRERPRTTPGSSRATRPSRCRPAPSPAASRPATARRSTRRSTSSSTTAPASA